MAVPPGRGQEAVVTRSRGDVGVGAAVVRRRRTAVKALSRTRAPSEAAPTVVPSRRPGGWKVQVRLVAPASSGTAIRPWYRPAGRAGPSPAAHRQPAMRGAATTATPL